LLNSRYCEVDRLSNVATELFGAAAPGWGRVQAICSWVNTKVTFGYQHARPTRTAPDVFTDRHAGESARNPSQWMPWNYRATLEAAGGPGGPGVGPLGWTSDIRLDSG